MSVAVLRHLSILGAGLALANCAGTGSASLVGQRTTTEYAVRHVPSPAQFCGQEQEGLKHGGGTWKLPEGGGLAGKIAYAGVPFPTPRFGDPVEIGSANYNCWNGPTPGGMTVDWYGYVVITGGQSNPFDFNNGNKSSALKSKTLQNSETYSVFVYSLADGSLLYSASVGSASHGVLRFSSPFENGFQWPGGRDGVEIELAH